MVVGVHVRGSGQREVWLRRGSPSSRSAPGSWQSLWVSDVGNAAARETLVTATPQMAAIWTDLFRSMMTSDRELRWREDGPGVGRDARIAFSGLLGRYFARAHLVGCEGVRLLVPLDTAKRWLRGTPYRIAKSPRTRGLEADWIGLDSNGLVIAEAKGTFNEGVRTWNGPNSTPQILRTAIGQAGRTAVFITSTRSKLPAKRWAIASRWATERNGKRPTLLAWDPEEEGLKDDDYRALGRILHRADIFSVMRGLGHVEAFDMLEGSELTGRVAGALRLGIGGRVLERGFSALVWPGGVEGLHTREDIERVHRFRDLSPNVAFATLSSRYAMNITNNPSWVDSEEDADPASKVSEDSGRFSRHAGLSVVWPNSSEEIQMFDE